MPGPRRIIPRVAAPAHPPLRPLIRQLYPYHLSDVMVLKLNTTPFTYYYDILSDMLKNDRSYDSLPNFTAADCVFAQTQRSGDVATCRLRAAHLPPSPSSSQACS